MKDKMFYGLCHVGIYCVDREESIAFYREHLGFSLDFCVEVQERLKINYLTEC